MEVSVEVSVEGNMELTSLAGTREVNMTLWQPDGNRTSRSSIKVETNNPQLRKVN